MMDQETYVRSVLECVFSGCKEELIELAVKRITEYVGSIKYGKWIPCSERLPEETGFYLVSVVYEENEAMKRIEHVEHSFFVPPAEAEDEEYWDYSNVVAWMPLPDVYKREER